MLIRKLAHLSDLHLDLSPESAAAAQALVDTLLAERVDHVVVTGDLTHQGAQAEYLLFRDIFAPLIDPGRLTFIPGNHDRTGEDAGGHWMEGRKVRTVEAPGLYLVCVDSTGLHNRNYFACHGELSVAELDAVDTALTLAPRDTLVSVLLHHHVLPLPEESFPERLATRMGWPHAAELSLGAELVERVRNRCDLILHGHRHIPHALEFPHTGSRELRVYNSGSSTELGGFRVFEHADGRLLGKPAWVEAQMPPDSRPSSGNLKPALQYLASQLGIALL